MGETCQGCPNATHFGWGRALCNSHIFAYSPISFAYFSTAAYCVLCRGMVNGEGPARAGRQPVMCLCVMCHRFPCCVISFFFLNMGNPHSPAHEDNLSTSSNETKKQNCVKCGKGQGGAKANYCITPQQREQFPHEPLTVKLTDSGEERLWCLCCGRPVAHEMKSSVKQHINNKSHQKREAK